MPQTRQTIAELKQNWEQLEALPQAIVVYGHDLAAGETLAFHHHRREVNFGLSAAHNPDLNNAATYCKSGHPCDCGIEVAEVGFPEGLL